MTRRHLARLRVAAAIAGAQLRRHRLRLGLAVVGVGLAVLAITLLAGTGVGVLETGGQQFETADRDLWVTDGETRLTTAGGGGFENSLTDSRDVAADLEAHEDVSTAAPLSFQTVYVGTGPDDEFTTFVGTGVPGGGSVVQVTDGDDLSGDPHYANGSYDGERTNEVLLDAETASELDVDVGDTIHVGGSVAAARETEVTVVGISPTFEQLLGTPTVVVPLAELHQATGATETEPATFVTVTVADGADAEAVRADLAESHPQYEIRTNQEQLEAVLQEQVVVLAAGAALVVLAFATGIALTYALLTLVCLQQRAAFAALTAQGVSQSLVTAAVVGQGLAIGIAGGLLGLALTPVATHLLERLAAAVVGFEGLVQTTPAILAGAFAVAVGIGTVAAALAGWRMSRTEPLEQL